MPEALIYDVFVSYAEADRAWVEGYLLAALEQAEVQCMYESAFALGVPRLLEFERAIKQSKRTLLIISAAYLADGLNSFIDTMGQAYGQETNTWPVIPLLRQSVPLPPRLSMLVGLRATNETEQESAIAQLCADLKRPLPAPAPAPDCPYPGMKPFDSGDQDRFFGRDQEIEELLERLRLHPFITVIGPSGSGKSSLVFAGLIPTLQRSKLFGSGGWRIQSMRPGETPQTTLKQTLAKGAQQKAARMLLVIDQFEELFTLSKQEAITFQESLLKLSKTPNVYLVLTVRADFYADLMTSLLWQEIQNYRLEVVPLNETGLRQAVLKPAEAVGVFVEPALVERLVTDAAGEPGMLPLVQETLVLLWQRLERRFLPLRAYEALVLPRAAYGGQEIGQKTGLQVAIARRADQAIKELKDDPEKQQAIARGIFLRLIQFGEGRADTRRQQSIEDLRAATDDPILFNKTLKQLVDCRLLTPSGDDKNSTRKIDIAHEALIAGWPTLQQWINKQRGTEQTRRRLLAKAEEWDRLGRRNGGLLDNIELSEAEIWLSTVEATELGHDKILEELIHNSRNAIRRVEINKRNRLALIVGLLSLALATLGFAWQQRNQYESTRAILDVQVGTATPDNTRTIFPVLDYYVGLADGANSNNEGEKAISYARSVLDLTTKIEKRMDESPDTFQTSDRQRMQKITTKAQDILITSIQKYRLPYLENYLKNKVIGTDKGGSFSLLENRFTDGALKETYKILMNDIGADANQSGLLVPQEEADRMPCIILIDIEKLWRKYTNNKCGWYGKERNLKEVECSELKGLTLTSSVFFSHDYGIPKNRLNRCGFKAKSDD